MLALWLTGYLTMLPALSPLEPIRLALFIAFLLLALATARSLARVLIGVAVAAALLTSGHGGGAEVLLAGVDFGIVFAVFLPTLVLVRETMDRAPETQAAQMAFAKLGGEDRLAGLTGSVHVLGAFLILGGLFMTGPFVAAEPDRARRRREALAAMRGFGLAVWWSPFTIGMAFALTNRPDVPLLHAMALGLLLALLGIAISLAVFTPGPAFKGLMRALQALQPITVPAGVSILAVVGVASLTPLGTVAAVGLVMPLLCFGRLAQLGVGQLLEGSTVAARRLNRLGDEFLLFTAAAIFGFTLQATGGAEFLAGWLALDRLLSIMVPLAIILLGIVLALIGVHSVVIGGLVVALLHPVEHRLPDLIEVATILIPWGAAAMISYSSLSVVTAVSVYRLSFMDFVWSPNIVFLVLMSGVVALVFIPLFWLG